MDVREIVIAGRWYRSGRAGHGRAHFITRVDGHTAKAACGLVRDAGDYRRRCGAKACVACLEAAR